MSLRFTGSAALQDPAVMEVAAGRDRLEEEVVALFDQYRDPLLRYLASLGLLFEDGEEVVQEVFLSLFRHLMRDRPRDNLRAWLFRVAHNLALKRRYRSHRDFTACADAGDLVIDPGPGPEAQLATQQTHLRLLAVVRALSIEDRRCLALRAEGLRYREIAKVLGWSLGTVSVSLTRSLARIGRAIGR